eukprot:SAG31_NODE_12038_length_975_cov_0.936073_1_plen_70_part_10
MSHGNALDCPREGDGAELSSTKPAFEIEEDSNDEEDTAIFNGVTSATKSARRARARGTALWGSTSAADAA